MALRREIPHPGSIKIDKFPRFANSIRIRNFIGDSCNMRIILAFLASMTLCCANAQTHLPIGTWSPGFPLGQPVYDLPGSNNLGQKWQLKPYTGLSAGYLFFNGGGTSYLAAPFGINLYHPLNNNFTAFAGVSATPLVFSVGSLYNQAYPGNNFSRG